MSLSIFSSDSAKKRTQRIAAMIVCVCLILSAEVAAVQLYERMPPRNKERIRMANRKEVVSAPESYDILILGDSTAAYGVIPLLFEELTGLKAYNLSTYANTAGFADIGLLQEYLDHHPAPKAIVDVRSFRMWALPQSFDMYQEYFPHRDITRFLGASGIFSFDQEISAYIAELFPSVRYRYALRQGLITRSFKEGRQSDLLSEDALTKGFIRKDPVLTEEAIPENLTLLPKLREGEQFTIPPENIVLLSYLCVVTQKNNIPLLVVPAPNAMDTRSSPDVMRFMEETRKLLLKTLEEEPGCRYLDQNRFYERQFMTDLSHTNGTGAIRFTEELAGDVMLLME